MYFVKIEALKCICLITANLKIYIIKHACRASSLKQLCQDHKTAILYEHAKKKLSKSKEDKEKVGKQQVSNEIIY